MRKLQAAEFWPLVAEWPFPVTGHVLNKVLQMNLPPQAEGVIKMEYPETDAFTMIGA